MKKFIILLLLAGAFGCAKKTEQNNQTGNQTSGSTTGTDLAVKGKEIFYMQSDVNNIKCADCHSDGTNTSNSLTQYFSNIIKADKRASTYSGMFTGDAVKQNAAGATVCYKSYLKKKEPMSQDMINALNAYYESLPGNDTAVMVYQTIALPTRDKTKLAPLQQEIAKLTGNADNGKMLFDKACGFCHNPDSKVKKVPDLFDEFEGNYKSISYNVYLGDGQMPFYHTDKLSTQDLADLATFLTAKK
jgi:mono/diheme cytochrome c family protein